MQIAIALYDQLTLLDAVGPYSVLAHVPGAEVRFVAESLDTIRPDVGTPGLTPDATFADTPAPDIVVVPGGPGSRRIATMAPLVDWLRAVHPGTTHTTSVCTGAFALGAAGILDGLTATTHWATLDRLAEWGAIPVTERVVDHGKVITAAGVSAGIDMGLTLAARLAGDDVARAIQLAIEYDPQPPFDAGSPAKAGPELVSFLVDGGLIGS
ncbi:MAG: DJ-1/PfpI family protein [Acidimicrobiales bacterium]